MISKEKIYKPFFLEDPREKSVWDRLTSNQIKNVCKENGQKEESNKIVYYQIFYNYYKENSKKQKGWQGRIIYDNLQFIEQAISQKEAKKKLKNMLTLHYLQRYKQYAQQQTQEWLQLQENFSDTKQLEQLLEKLKNPQTRDDQLTTEEKSIKSIFLKKQTEYSLNFIEILDQFLLQIKIYSNFDKIITIHEQSEAKIKDQWKKYLKETKEEIQLEDIVSYIKRNMVVNLYFIDRENVLGYQPQYGQKFLEYFTESSEIQKQKNGNLYGTLFLDVVRSSNAGLVKTQQFIQSSSLFKDSSDVVIIYLCGLLSQLQNLKINFITQDHFGNTLQYINKNLGWLNPQLQQQEYIKSYYSKFYEDSYDQLDKINYANCKPFNDFKLKQNSQNIYENEKQYQQEYQQNSNNSDSFNIDSEISDIDEDHFKI